MHEIEAPIVPILLMKGGMLNPSMRASPNSLAKWLQFRRRRSYPFPGHSAQGKTCVRACIVGAREGVVVRMTMKEWHCKKSGGNSGRVDSRWRRADESVWGNSGSTVFPIAGNGM